MDKKITEKMDFEANRVTHLMSFLIENTQDVNPMQDAIKVMNVVRLAVAEKWVETMKERLKKTYGEEMYSAFDKTKELLEASDLK